MIRSDSMNWIEEAAQTADPRQDRVTLENPEAIAELDTILMEKYYPPIRRALQKTGYPFSSVDDGRIPISSSSEGFGLGRALTFMLFDQLGGAIFRGSLIRSRKGHMFKREFFLGLPENTDPSFLFRIVAAEEFSGMLPGITIQPPVIHPEWDNTYYHITLQASSGLTSGPWTLDQGVIGNIEETVSTSVAMYEATIGGFETMAEVDAFILLARRCFEAS